MIVAVMSFICSLISAKPPNLRMLNASLAIVIFCLCAPEQGSNSLAPRNIGSASSCSLSFDTLRCSISPWSYPRAMIHFLGRPCQLSKNSKQRDAAFLGALIEKLLNSCVLCAFFLTGCVVECHFSQTRTAIDKCTKEWPYIQCLLEVVMKCLGTLGIAEPLRVRRWFFDGLSQCNSVFSEGKAL